MKIICIGRNYKDHAKELNNEIPSKPVFFLKPDSSIIHNNKPFFYPPFSNEIHYECELVVKINRLGLNIEKRFAQRYYNEITVGIDFTARDLQREQQQKGLPWEISKAFDRSAAIGKFLKIENYTDLSKLNFSLDINDKRVQTGNLANMIFSIDEIIAYVTQFITLKTGDLIFTGTPSGVGPVNINDQLCGKIEDDTLFNFRIK